MKNLPLGLPLGLPCAGAMLVASTFLPAHAQTERELGAHEHGAATLDVVLDGTALLVDLDSPAANLLGFEHTPSTDDQRELVARAKRLLESGELLVPDAAAGCTLDSADVTMELAADDPDHDDEAGHDAMAEADDHDADHDADHDDDHDADHDDHADADHDEAEHAGHSDVEAAWSFTCESPERLARIATGFFDEFDGFADIDVQVAGPAGQTLVELTPGNTTIELGSTP